MVRTGSKRQKHFPIHYPYGIDHGYTLIEMMVVLFLIALTAAIIAPKLALRENKGLRAISGHLASESRALYWEAISRQKVIRLYYDLDKKTISAFQIEPNGEKKLVQTPESSPWNLPKYFRFDRIVTLHQGKVDSGKTFTQYFPSGSVEPTTIHLSDQTDRSLTLVIGTLNGKVRIYKGDVRVQHIPPLVPGIPGGGASPFIGGG
ncbi:MAG: prepilin-type N-terminal cleavage/methylation domain-containing protein [Leptospirales bacterium]